MIFGRDSLRYLAAMPFALAELVYRYRHRFLPFLFQHEAGGGDRPDSGASVCRYGS